MKSLTKTIKAIAQWTSLTEDVKQQVCTAVLNYFGAECQDEAAIAALAEALANSGERYKWPPDIYPLGGVISTGGPSSLSTLLCPYIAAAAGCYIPNVTVPGTVAGALDVLALVRDYKTNFRQDEMIQALRASRVANTLTSLRFAPADGYLFSMRKCLSKKDVPALVVASLLAKKLAASNYTCAVDIRCGRLGNFGDNLTECRKNAELLIRVAERLRMRVRCVVTDITQPLMPYLGRPESLQALLLALSGDRSDPWLTHHIETCVEIATQSLMAAGLAVKKQQAKAMAEQSLSGGTTKHALQLNLLSQGSSISMLERIMEANEGRTKKFLTSPKSGYVEYIDCGALAMSLIRAATHNSSYGDSIGLICLKAPGDKVESHEPIVELRYPSSLPLGIIDRITLDALSAYRIVTRAQGGLPVQIMGIIS